MPSVLRQNWLLDRRHALCGAGAVVALPLLDCMRPLRAAPAARARPAIFVYLPNGVNTADWSMPADGPGYTLSKPLASLEKHRAAVTPVSGMHHPNGLGHHHNCQNIWLTGGKPIESARNTISVDQLIAQASAPHTRFASLELSAQGRSLAWTADGVILPATASPGAAFRDLFEEPKGGVAAQRRGFERRGSVLDAVLGEARALADRVGAEDRDRLDQYLTSIREVEVRTRRAERWLNAPRPKVDPAAAARLGKDLSVQALGEFQRAMYDLIVLAFQTDTTRVATFCTGEEGKGPPVPEIGVTQDRHSLSHHNGNPRLMADLTESDAFNVRQFAYLLDRLADTRDADGPLLDSTVALFGSGMAYGHSHGNASLPLVLAGGTALGLRHGRHVDFNKVPSFQGYGKHPGMFHKPVNEKARMSNLLLTVAQCAGVPVDSFGDSTGRVGELLA